MLNVLPITAIKDKLKTIKKARPKIQYLWDQIRRGYYWVDSDTINTAFSSFSNNDFVCEGIIKLILTNGLKPVNIVEALFDQDLKDEYYRISHDKINEQVLWDKKHQEELPHRHALAAFTITNECNREIAILESKKQKYQPVFNGQPEEDDELHLRRMEAIRAEYRQRWVMERNRMTEVLKPIHEKYKKEIARVRRINEKERRRLFWIFYQQQEDRWIPTRDEL